MISAISNTSVLNSNRYLNKANNKLDTIYKRLSSGLRINSAKDNPGRSCSDHHCQCGVHAEVLVLGRRLRPSRQLSGDVHHQRRSWCEILSDSVRLEENIVIDAFDGSRLRSHNFH